MKFFEVVSLVAVRSNHKWIWALRVVLVTKRIPGKSCFEHCSTREVVQLFYGAQIRIEIAFYGCRCRSEQRKSLAVFILHIVQEAKTENVIWAKIDLHLGKVAAAH